MAHAVVDHHPVPMPDAHQQVARPNSRAAQALQLLRRCDAQLPPGPPARLRLCRELPVHGALRRADEQVGSVALLLAEEEAALHAARERGAVLQLVELAAVQGGLEGGRVEEDLSAAACHDVLADEGARGVGGGEGEEEAGGRGGEGGELAAATLGEEVKEVKESIDVQCDQQWRRNRGRN